MAKPVLPNDENDLNLQQPIVENQVEETIVTPPQEGEEQKAPESAGPELAPEGVPEEFLEARAKLIEANPDLVVQLDAKFANGEEFTEEEIAVTAEAHGSRPADVKSWLKVQQENHKLRQRVQEEDQKNASLFLSELDELAGEGGHKGVMDYVAAQRDAGVISPTKVDMWNAALATNNPEVQKEVIKEMAALRLSKNPPSQTPPIASGNQAAPNKPADLSLLAKAAVAAGVAESAANKNEASSPAQVESNGNPLENNPLQNASRQALCQIKVSGPGHAQYLNALEVLKVKHPDLA